MSDFFSSLWKLINSLVNLACIIAGFYFLHKSNLDLDTKSAIGFLYLAQASLLWNEK